MAQVLNWQFRWTDDWSQSLEKAERHLDQALRISPQVAFVHYIAAVFYLWKKDLDRSAAEADVALNLNPNYAQAHNSRGIVNIYGGQPLAAVPHIEQAIRLDPAIKHLYVHFLGSAYLVAGDYKAAASLFRERILLSPKTDLSRLPCRRAWPFGRGRGCGSGLARTDGNQPEILICRARRPAPISQ
jgi:adenylate cyclase